MILHPLSSFGGFLSLLLASDVLANPVPFAKRAMHSEL